MVQRNPSVSLSGGIPKTSKARLAEGVLLTQQPVYEDRFNAAAYNAFVAEQQALLERNLLAQREARGQQLKGEQAAREKKALAREKKFGFFETNPFLAGRTRTARQRVEVGRSGRLTERANADVQEYARRESERVRQEVEGAKPRFTERVLVGYQSVPVVYEGGQRVSGPEKIQLALKKVAETKTKEAVSFKEATPLLPFGSGAVAPGYEVKNGKVVPVKEKEQVDSARFANEWNKKTDIERTIALGNVYSAIAQGKKGKELEKVLIVNKVPVGQNIKLPGLIGTPVLSTEEQIAKDEGELARYAFRLKGAEIALDESGLKEKQPLVYQATSFGQGAIGGVVGTGLLAQDVAFGGGKKTVAGVKQIIADPGKFGSTIVEEATLNPARFGGELVGSYVSSAGIGKAGKIVSKGVGRIAYTTKGVIAGEKFGTAFQASKGAGIGTIRTDIVSKVTGRKTIKLGDITTKDIADDLLTKGQAQYLEFPASEKALFQRATTGEQATFIKQTFKDLGIKQSDVIGFTAESGKATGIIEAITKKGVVKFGKVGSEPYGKFVASRTATGPLIGVADELPTKLSLFPKLAMKPSVTITVAEAGTLSTQGGIKASIKRLGFDVAKLSDDAQRYFDRALKSGARPPKLKELRNIFGKKAVAKGETVGDIGIKGRIVSSPSRTAGLTIEEELILPFASKTKVLGTLKQRLFSPAVVEVKGARLKLNIKQATPEIGKSSAQELNKLAKASGKTASRVSEPVSVQYSSVLDKALISQISKASKPSVSKTKVSFASKPSGISTPTKISISNPISITKPSTITLSQPSQPSKPSQTIAGITYNQTPSYPRTTSTITTPKITRITTTTTPRPTTKPQLGISTKTRPITTITTIPGTKKIIPSFFTKTTQSPIMQRKRLLTAVKGFDVFARKKGKAFLVGKNLPINKALSTGAGFTSRDISRSFAIKPSGYTLDKDLTRPVNLFGMFRAPKPGRKVAREGYIFTEKTKYAIDTLLEKKTLQEKRKQKKSKK